MTLNETVVSGRIRITTDHPEATGVWRKHVTPSLRHSGGSSSTSAISMAVWSTPKTVPGTQFKSTGAAVCVAKRTPYSVLAAVLITMLALAAMTSKKPSENCAVAPAVAGVTPGNVRPIQRITSALKLSPSPGPGLLTGNAASVLPTSTLPVTGPPAPVLATEAPLHIIPDNSLMPMKQEPAVFFTAPH